MAHPGRRSSRLAWLASLAIPVLFASPGLAAPMYRLKDFGEVDARLEDPYLPRLEAVAIGLDRDGRVTFGVKPVPDYDHEVEFSTWPNGEGAFYLVESPGYSKTPIPAPQWGRPLHSPTVHSWTNPDDDPMGRVLFVVNDSIGLPDDSFRSFLFTPGPDGGSTATIPRLAGFGNTWAIDLNSAGMIVGEALDGRGIAHAFVSDGLTSWDLNELIGPDSGLVLVEAVAIGDLGQIVGYAKDLDGDLHEFLLTPVSTPEPSTLALFAVAIVALRTFDVRRRRPA